MNENSLKAALVPKIKAALTHAVVFSHSDRVAGVPDVSVTWKRCTTWWELKHAQPTIRSRGVQDLKIRELEYAGRAYYVIYHEKGGVKRTLIVSPQELHRHGKECDDVTPVAWAQGFDHQFVVEFIKGVHT